MTHSGNSKGTSKVEVTAVTQRGITLRLDEKRQFLSYKEFPWFKGAPKRHILNVLRPQADHLSWPDLDVDLEVDSITSPNRYPLIASHSPIEPQSRSRPKKKGRP